MWIGERIQFTNRERATRAHVRLWTASSDVEAAKMNEDKTGDRKLDPEEAMEIVRAVREHREELGLKKGRLARPASSEALRFEAQVEDSWRTLRSKEISSIRKLSSTDKKRKVDQVVELVLQGRALEIDVTPDALLQLAGKDRKPC